VNPDASLFCRAPGSDLVERRGGVAPIDHFGSAVRHTGSRGAGPAARNLRRNRFGRGRSSRRSRPACGRPRRGTAAPTPPRHGMAEHQVDLRHDCRDVGPACVPSTDVGHGVEPNRQVQISAPCLPLKRGSLTRQRRRVSQRPMPPDASDPTRHTPIAEPLISEISNRTSHQAVRYRAPDSRGFRQPSTGGKFSLHNAGQKVANARIVLSHQYRCHGFHLVGAKTLYPLSPIHQIAFSDTPAGLSDC
jgi:hypothetical protein